MTIILCLKQNLSSDEVSPIDQAAFKNSSERLWSMNVSGRPVEIAAQKDQVGWEERFDLDENMRQELHIDL
jgi:hypothetical protein